jgi:hypothetical protein
MTDKFDKPTAIVVMRALAQGMRNTLQQIEREGGDAIASRYTVQGVQACIGLTEGCAKTLEENPKVTVESFVSQSMRIFQDG